MRFLLIFGLVAGLPIAGLAQDREQTLADIRQDLTLLNVEVQRLKRELSTTGGSTAAGGGGTLLDRVQVIEAELTRLTGKTEQLEFRINQVVTDGTKRIGDLEFRLVELEGGDVGQLGDTTTLGGGTTEELPAAPVAPAPPASGDGPALALSEEEDFRRAGEALATGDFRSAADLFATFNETYPGGPLATKASLGRGQALEGLGDLREAARAYLNAYSVDTEGPDAATALVHLGRALGALGQMAAACQTLGEIETRFPAATQVQDAQAEMQNLNCT
ncbi:tetratricopeptide repeat protein [Marinovum sp. 2_MG-2023]|uniref:tetratricopeptide repeat protein n=1 Tax=unclassified Marinovum TaxID=2647166 RepID=UPI0026E2CC81|nr:MULTISPECIES: tetratricopeptide repeat protein [unclassified Marinovum]MDO6731693.1 tetratricopeptide repeat protein [Marinovum sp. 2_MG-2023]MDO6780945.1 tetratricopeptide repeat protein [Marinovum sp. 1_MG-2023]